jgi:hypothetical protein
MRRIRFHIGTLLAIVFILGIALAALRESNDIWDSGLFTLIAMMLLTSVLLAIHRNEGKRAFWLGFALFGAAYLGLSLIPSIEPRLVTTKAIAYVDSKLPRSMPVRLAYADYDNDGDVDLFVANNAQPSAVFVDKGKGTFQDITTTVLWNYAGDLATRKGMIFLNNSAGLWSVGTTENFVRIGHSLLALVAAVIGGQLSRQLHEKNRQTAHGPDFPRSSTLPVAPGD